MVNAIEHFRANIERVELLGALYEALCHLTTPVIDCSDLLRAQIVMAVSALDHYVHEVTRLGMLEVLAGSRRQTPGFLRFQVRMGAAMAGLTGRDQSAWFDTEVREKHSYLAFQYPDKIADAIRLFSPRQLWSSVGLRLGLPIQEVKERLQLVIERRNKIAHEADLDPSYPGVRWPILQEDATAAVNVIKAICEAIHSVVV